MNSCGTLSEVLYLKNLRLHNLARNSPIINSFATISQVLNPMHL
jgi:hypothetical protein